MHLSGMNRPDHLCNEWPYQETGVRNPSILEGEQTPVLRQNTLRRRHGRARVREDAEDPHDLQQDQRSSAMMIRRLAEEVRQAGQFGELLQYSGLSKSFVAQVVRVLP